MSCFISERCHHRRHGTWKGGLFFCNTLDVGVAWRGCVTGWECASCWRVLRLMQQWQRAARAVWQRRATTSSSHAVCARQGKLRTGQVRTDTLRSGRIEGLSATPFSSHLAESRNKHFDSPLDGRWMFTWRGSESCPNAADLFNATLQTTRQPFELKPPVALTLPRRRIWTYGQNIF